MGGKIYFADDIEKMFPDPIGDYGFAPEELLDEEVPGALKRFCRVSSDMGSLMDKIRFCSMSSRMSSAPALSAARRRSRHAPARMPVY